MEFVVAKAFQLSLIGFGIGGGFRAFCLTEDYLKHRLKPPSPIADGGALNALGSVPLKAAQHVTPSLHAEESAIPFAERMEPHIRRHVAPRWQPLSLAALRFLLVPPPPSNPPTWPDIFWKAGDAAPSRARIASQIIASSCHEGVRTASLLALGTLVMGAAALHSAPRPVNVDHLMDVRDNAGAAGIGVAAVVYIHANAPSHSAGEGAATPPLARLPRLLIAALCGGGFVMALRHGRQQRRQDDW